MPSFGHRSTENLATAHHALQYLFQEVVKRRDCACTCGRRVEDEQARMVQEGRSMVSWPNGNHNVLNPADLARAVDVSPWIKGNIPWNDGKAFVFFAGYVFRVAEELGIPIRWGGDWDRDLRLDDQRLNDYPHFELARGWEPPAGFFPTGWKPLVI